MSERGEGGAEEFDAFYKDTRTDLLLQTYALTGDLPASAAAVRQAYVVAWHHWRKWSRHQPASQVRPLAWRLAQRRHTARLWHRDKSLAPEDQATLDALGKLSVDERRVLLLNHLASISLAEQAREVGLPRPEAEATLQRSTAQFALLRDVPTTGIDPLFARLRAVVADHRWPRSTILRREGAQRRRAHTVAGALAGVAVFVASGAVVTQAADGHPVAAPAPTPPATPAPPPPQLDRDALLSSGQVSGYLPLAQPSAQWQERTRNNLGSATSASVPCQGGTFGGRKATGAFTRTFTGKVARLGPTEVTHFLERAPSGRTAARAYADVLTWFSRCTAPGTRLLATDLVDHVGDEAMLFRLEHARRPAVTWYAGVALSGELVSAAVTQVPTVSVDEGSDKHLATTAARLLAASVNGVCRGPYGGDGCAEIPALHPHDPLPLATARGLLGELDLPPVSGISRPWVGTEPEDPTSNPAATSCDHASFDGPRVSQGSTRTFVVPGARLPAEFGISETVGRVKDAPAFVADVRKKMAGCPDEDLASTVTRIADSHGQGSELAVWRVTSEVTERRKVTFYMGIARQGNAVAQVGFVPAGHPLAPAEFVSVVRRAAERLSGLPG